MNVSQMVPFAGDEERTAYRYLVATGGGTLEALAHSMEWTMSQAEHVLAALRTMSLVMPAPEGRGQWVAVDPEIAKRRYAKPLSTAIDTWQGQLDGLRAQLDTLTTFCAPGDGENDGLSPVVTVTGADDIRDALDAAAARCVDDVIVMQPVGRGTPVLTRHVVERVPGVLSARVRVRVLFPHVSRYDAEAREYVARTTASGGEARSTASPLPALVVFDRSAAFLLGCDDRTEVAHIVRHRALVDFIAHMAESAWATGEVFQGAGGRNRIPEHLTQEMKAIIVHLLAAGYKDEVVARRLGIAVRTCRKYIAEIFGDLGAQSRFQAGWMLRDRIPTARTGDDEAGHETEPATMSA